MRDKICKAKSIMTDEWIEGYYARKGIDEKTYKHYILEPTISVTGAEYNDVCFFVEIEVDEETVSEFTGLMDKNDTKIFENDIISAHPDESSVGSYPRDRLKRTQTPQAFHLGDICNVHREALEKGITNSVASCTLMIEMGRQVYFSMGSEKNIKLTTVDDIDIFKALLAAKRSSWLKD